MTFVKGLEQLSFGLKSGDKREECSQIDLGGTSMKGTAGCE